MFELSLIDSLSLLSKSILEKALEPFNILLFPQIIPVLFKHNLNFGVVTVLPFQSMQASCECSLSWTSCSKIMTFFVKTRM